MRILRTSDGVICASWYIDVSIAGMLRDYILRYMLKALYLRCIAFNCWYGVFTRIYCLTFNIGGFWRALVGVGDVCRVAFPLVVLSRLEFSLVLRFWRFRYILIGVKCFNAIVSDFRAFEPLRLSFPLSLGAPLVPVLRSVMRSGVALVPFDRGVYPPLLCLNAWAGGVTSTLTIKKTF